MSPQSSRKKKTLCVFSFVAHLLHSRLCVVKHEKNIKIEVQWNNNFKTATWKGLQQLHFKTSFFPVYFFFCLSLFSQIKCYLFFRILFGRAVVSAFQFMIIKGHTTLYSLVNFLRYAADRNLK